MKQMELKNIKHIIWILWVLNVVIDIISIITLIFLKFADNYIPGFLNYVYDGSVIKETWRNGFLIFNLVCFIIIFILSIISFVLTVYIKSKDKNFKIIFKIIISIMMFVFSFGIFGFGYIIVIGDNILYQPEYYEFSDGNHNIVICEETFFVGGYGTVYQVNDDNSAYMIKEFITDDGYRNNGDYEFEWSDDCVDIYYLNGVEDNKIIDNRGNIKYKLTANFKE